MKKILKVFSILLISIIIVSGCSIGKKEVTYKGKSMNVTFKVNSRYLISTKDEDVINLREKAVLLGSNFKIGIEENDTISSSKYNGDFNKYKDNFKNETDFKEVTYNGIKGFQKYYRVYKRYEIYLPVSEKVCLKLNVYSDSDSKKELKKCMNSKEVQDILNSISIKNK